MRLRFRYSHELLTTLLMALYSLSFAAVDSHLLRPALFLAGVSLFYFPIYLAVTRMLKAGPLKENLFLPLDIAIAVSTITNVMSFGSPPFFAVMFILQVFILAIGFLWSAYEFARAGRTLQFFLSFALWSVVVVSVDNALR